jgi:hypothetical protein
MHLIEHAPRTYRHRGYTIQISPISCWRWTIWRPRADEAVCTVYTLREAQEAIEEDLIELRRGA